MPIKHLQRGASFPRLGELRKGAPKPATGNKPGRDLDHFRFTSNDQEAERRFAAIYGNEPQAVNVFLPYDTTAENWEAWQEEWRAGGLVHRCDGEKVLMIQRSGEYIRPDNMACPGNCKPVGRLKVIIPELARLAYVMALTTSINDIIELESNLLAYEALRGSLCGIPFILSRVPRMVSTPGPDGKRLRREKWLLHLEAAPEWVQAQLSVMQQAALPSGSYVDHETGEIIEPDQDIEDGNVYEGEIVEETTQNGQPENLWPDEIKVTSHAFTVGQSVIVRGKNDEKPGEIVGLVNDSKYRVKVDGRTLTVGEDKLAALPDVAADRPLFEDAPQMTGAYIED